MRLTSTRNLRSSSLKEEFALIAEAMLPSDARDVRPLRRMRMQREDGIAGTAEDRGLIEVVKQAPFAPTC
jgi:hypothetical protein